MSKSEELAKLLGLLIQKSRVETMDQTEIGLRIGVGRGTISNMESGRGVKSTSLFEALALLDNIDPLIEVVSQQLSEIENNPQRKARRIKAELANDF